MPAYLYRCNDCGQEVNYSAPVGDVAGDCDVTQHPTERRACTGQLRRVWAVNINIHNLRSAR